MKDQDDQLMQHIVDIRERLKQREYESEAAVSDGVVKRLLEAVGWPRYDQRIVYPQFRIGTDNRRVDYALCDPPGKARVLLEVKDVGEINTKAETQLFEYCNSEEVSVKVAVLTDGRTWKLYYPYGVAGHKDRLFREINLLEHDPVQIARDLKLYLEFDAVKSGDALQRSESEYQEFQSRREFRLVWDKLLNEPDKGLVRLIKRKFRDERLTTPKDDKVVAFLGKQASKRSTTLHGPTPNDPTRKLEDATGSPFFRLDGKTTLCRTAKEVFVGIFREFAMRDTNFCERYASTQKTGGKRLELAPRAEDLYPPGSKWARTDFTDLPGGWCLATHLNNEQKEKRIQRACRVAGIVFDRDLIMSLTK